MPAKSQLSQILWCEGTLISFNYVSLKKVDTIKPRGPLWFKNYMNS